MKSLRVLSATAVILLSTLSAFAQVERAHGPEFRAAGAALMCQCGCNQTISSCSMEHCHSAEPIREEIWDRLGKGESIAGIVEMFKERYGLVILSAPPTEGFHLTAWFMPIVAFVFGALVIGRVLRAWRQQTVAAAVVTPISAADRARIEKELQDLS